MALCRYRYRPVTAALPLQRYRDSPSATVTRPLLTVTESYCYLRYKRYQRYINFFIKL